MVLYPRFKIEHITISVRLRTQSPAEYQVAIVNFMGSRLLMTGQCHSSMVGAYDSLLELTLLLVNRRMENLVGPQQIRHWVAPDSYYESHGLS